MEYKRFAKYYDQFYQKKDYEKEVEFLTNFIKPKDEIIDIGCGTGMHASILQKKGVKIDGLDLNKEMLNIAKKRINGNLYNQNILSIKVDKKYNLVISMFAVINHLKDTNELETAFLNLKNLLLPNGRIIIDLHNPQASGKKEDFYDNMSRTMVWNYDKNLKIEISNIIFNIDGKSYEDKHLFRIFSINEIKTAAKKVGLNVIAVYENYDIKKEGNVFSKNIQFLIQ